MTREKSLEDVLAKYPELIEQGLRLVGRQMEVCGRRIDLLFEDAHQRQLLVELKWGPIKDEHIGQIMHYSGGILARDRPDLRVMLVGTRVPLNLQYSLDYHGIAWKELSQATVLAFLRGKQDQELITEFENEVASITERAKAAKAHSPKSPDNHRRRPNELARPDTAARLALLMPVEEKPLKQAFDEFASGKDHILFGTDGNLKPASEFTLSKLSTVYFKAKGDPRVIARATLLEITEENRPADRLGGLQNVKIFKWYYGFRGLTLLPEPIPVSSLRHYRTGKAVRDDFPGPWIVEEIMPARDEAAGTAM